MKDQCIVCYTNKSRKIVYTSLVNLDRSNDRVFGGEKKGEEGGGGGSEWMSIGLIEPFC